MDSILQDMVPERPEPVLLYSEPYYTTKKSDPGAVAEILLSGERVRITDQYPVGLSILSALKRMVFGTKREDDFTAYRKKRTDFRIASNNLLVPIANNSIALRKSPDIGWLDILYPDIADFTLSFPQIQGLNSSWQWYSKGIAYPVLKKKLFPWYGTYFPTRTDHLVLFDTWLQKYQGSKSTALDMGTGCGVLAFQLLQNGFNQVIAMDSNPNAVISVREDAKRLGVEGRLKVRRSDLFDDCHQKSDLIVFNPPWLPADNEGSGLDKAIYYEPELFDRFFSEAGKFVTEDGKIVLFFSNLGRTAGVQAVHPIEEELANYRRFRKCQLLKQKVAGSSRKTRRRENRTGEFVELWELEKTGS